MVDFGYISSYMSSSSSQRLKYVCHEGNVKERERFWNDLDRIVDRVGNDYVMCARRSEWMGWRYDEGGHN